MLLIFWHVWKWPNPEKKYHKYWSVNFLYLEATKAKQKILRQELLHYESNCIN